MNTTVSDTFVEEKEEIHFILETYSPLFSSLTDQGSTYLRLTVVLLFVSAGVELISCQTFLRTLGEAWTQLKKSLHDEAEVHLKFSNKVTSKEECVYSGISYLKIIMD